MNRFSRLPFFYGWVVVAVSFVTLAFGVNARTSFSLLFPPLLDELGWERGVTAAAFSIGFLASTIYAPFSGMLMDRFGPRVVLSLGVILVSLGMASAPFIQAPWHLYLTLGVLVVGGIFLSVSSGIRCFCPTGLYGGGDWRSASRFRAWGSARRLFSRSCISICH